MCTLCAPLLGSGVERHVDIPVPVHGPGDIVGEEGVGVLQRLVQQQLLCLHRPVLHDVLEHLMYTVDSTVINQEIKSRSCLHSLSLAWCWMFKRCAR